MLLVLDDEFGGVFMMYQLVFFMLCVWGSFGSSPGVLRRASGFNSACPDYFTPVIFALRET